MRAEQWEAEEENDWILLDETDFEDNFQVNERENKQEEQKERKQTDFAKRQSLFLDKANNLTKGAEWLLFFYFNSINTNSTGKEKPFGGIRFRLRQMALDSGDIRLIRASWLPVRKDPSGAGALLFKGLFVKFPDYLKLFSQFSDLDIEQLQENKRLIKHAIKVIDTVTFVIDSIGDESQAEQLNGALLNLQRRNGPSSTINNSSSSPSSSPPPPPITALETNLLVKAWTKLYDIILDLVESEESATNDQ